MAAALSADTKSEGTHLKDVELSPRRSRNGNSIPARWLGRLEVTVR